MFMNDSNLDEQLSVSPLQHDVDGRFSRKGQSGVNPPKYNTNFIENILIFLFIYFLIATDFILFSGSGNIKVFDGSVFPIPEVSWILLGIAIFVCAIVYIVNKIPMLKYFVVALFSLGFVYILFKQFYQISQKINLGGNEIPLYIIIGIIISVLVFIVLAQDQILYKIMAVITVAVMFAHVYMSYMHPDGTSYDYMETHNTQKASNTKNKRFIYFMFPNLVSYPYLSMIPGIEAANTQKIMQGFLQKNKFKIYTQAYVTEENYLENMVRSFNLSSRKDIKEYLLNTRMLSSYWSFHNLRNEYINLKENELYDIFHKNKFQISAYKSRDFDMCHKKHKYNVNRCIEKINRPTNIYRALDVSEKVSILFVEWLSSMKLVTNMSTFYNIFSIFVDADTMPMIGVNYNNLYVVNSIMTFDLLLDNIKQDTGKQAYFVFIDMPADMYIYDEFCRIKPRNEWLNMVNLPWILHDYTEQRRTAYLQQTRCLFGKLEQFVGNLKKEELWKDSVMVIQGVSSVNDFKNYPLENTKENFFGNRLVTMAIYDSHMNEDELIDSKLCTTKGILAEYMFKSEQCYKSRINLHQKILQEISYKLNKLSANITKDMVPTFKKWYKQWVDINGGEIFDENRIIKTENKTVEDFGLDDFDMDDLELNDQVFEK